jgi:hypothetical protein
MPERPIQLQPPAITLDADLRWVLLAAFCRTPSLDLGVPACAARAARLVREFSLVGQVTSRLSRQQLFTLLAPAEVDGLMQLATLWTMRGLAAAQVTHQVGEIAAQERIDIALLKQAALRSFGLVTPAQRHASDVDLLLRPAEVEPLCAALERRGFSLERKKQHAHGVVVLRSESNIGVELHSRIVGIRLEPGGPQVDLNALFERHLLTSDSSKQKHVWLPHLGIVGVHLVWQGWSLFRYAPHAPEHKSPFRVLCDLQHLGAHADAALAAEIRGLLPASVPRAEYDALVELSATLARGSCEPSSDGARCVLNHVLATKLDSGYRDSLYLARQRDAMRAEGIFGWTRRQLRRAFLPSREELEHLLRSRQAANPTMARVRLPLQLASSSFRGVLASIRRSRGSSG